MTPAPATSNAAVVEILNDPEEVVLVVHPPRLETEEGEEAGEELEEEETRTEPEVIKKGKEEPEEAE